MEKLTPQKGQPVAMMGVDPVTLMDRGRAVMGHPLYWWNHGGKTYYFANPGAAVAFMNNPERYVPINDGNCLVTHAKTARDVPGDPAFSQVYKGKLYLFAGVEEQELFNEMYPDARNESANRLWNSPPAPRPTAQADGKKSSIVLTSGSNKPAKPDSEGRISGWFRRVFKK